MALDVGQFLGIVLTVILLHVVAIIGYRRIVVVATQEPVVDNKEDDRRNSTRISKPKVKILQWILLVLIVASWACSIGTTSACNFVTVVSSNDDDLAVHFGMNALDSTGNGQCQFHSFKDGVIRTGFAYGILNAILSSVGVILVVILKFVWRDHDQPKAVWWNVLLRTTMYISLWCCLFTFYIHEAQICDDQTCSLGPAGMVQIVNVVVLVAISLLMHLMDPLLLLFDGEYNDERESNSQTDAVDNVEFRMTTLPNGNENEEGVLISAYLETNRLLANGSIQHKVEQLHSDGSRSIHVTIDNSSSIVTPRLDHRTTDRTTAMAPSSSQPLMDGVIVDNIPILDP